MQVQYRSRKRIKRKLITAFVIAVLVLFGLYLFINTSVVPPLIAFSEARITSIAMSAMNEAILEALQDSALSDSIMEVQETGSRIYMQANSAKLSRLGAVCIEKAQARLEELGSQGIEIPVGTLTGVPLLSGWGPDLQMSFLPAGAITANYESKFFSAGINQTLHRVYLRLNADLSIILPGISHPLTVSTQVPIIENVIVGDVPDAYTNVANEEDLLNLVPKPIE